mgnify:FL=1
MKKFVINLPERTDRLDLFNTTNPFNGAEPFKYVFDGRQIDHDELIKLGFDTNKDWKDPILQTHLTKGEVGCFLSHWYVWQYAIESNETIIVFEDDAIIGDRYNEKEIQELLEVYNFIYLGYKEMGKREEVNDTIVIPDYPYWTVSYVVTPEAARILTTEHAKKNIIPVDEYLPIALKNCKPVAYKNNVVTPHSRSKVGSDVYASSREDFFIDFKTHHVTVGTDEWKCKKLYESAQQNNIDTINLGKGIVWEGGDMNKSGGGHKVNLLREYISMLPDHDVLFFSDAYDIILCTSLDEITGRYLEFKHDIIFSSERFCWPDEELATEIISTNKTIEPYNDTPYKYLNSGMFIGKVKHIKELLHEIPNDSDDQLYYQKEYISMRHDIVLDLEGYIFTCFDPKVTINQGQLYNPVTKCYSCVYHGNGGESAKEHYKTIYDKLYSSSLIAYIPTHNYEIISDDIICIDFMTPYMCDRMIEIADGHKFDKLSYDKVPGKELRLTEMGLWEELEKHWLKTVYDISYKYWEPCHIYGLRDAFIIRYSMDTQRSLKRHHDASLVTGSVKLNDEYTGGLLEFPRQGITNKDIPVGKCLLFPGQVSHPHLSSELESGVKYSLTIWSSRYTGDNGG